MHESRISLEDRDEISHESSGYGGDLEANRRYLTFSWWLLHRGWKRVMEEVQAGVQEVFGSVDPREDISDDGLSELTVQVRKKVEGATEVERRSAPPPSLSYTKWMKTEPVPLCRNHKWLRYLLPPEDQESFVLQESGVQSSSPSPPSTSTPSKDTTTLRLLLDETSDLIDSPTFTHVLTQLLDAGFSTLIDQKISAQVFSKQHPNPPPPPPPSPTTTTTEEIRNTTTKVATILAIMTRQAHSISNSLNNNNDYLQAMDACHDLDAFSAVIYSSNFEREVVVGGAGGATTTTTTTTTGEEKEKKKNKVKDDESVMRYLVDGRHAANDEEMMVKGTDIHGSSSSTTTTTTGFESVWGKAVEVVSSQDATTADDGGEEVKS